jgi:hypothetical protein
MERGHKRTGADDGVGVNVGAARRRGSLDRGDVTLGMYGGYNRRESWARRK